LTALLVLASVLLQLQFQAEHSFVLVLRAEWGLWLVVCQLAGMGAILWLRRRPLSRRERRWLVLFNAALLGIAGLYSLRLFEPAMIRSLEILLRLAVFSAWGLALGGLPAVVWAVARAARSRQALAAGAISDGPQPRLALARWWFSAVVTLLIAEPLAAFLLWRQDLLTFPESLPAPPAGELHVAAIGGSSTMGHPYAPKFGFPQVAAWRLQQMYPRQTVVLNNIARPGRNLRQAIGCLHELQHRPHLLLVYSAHNEFFHELEEMAVAAESPLAPLDVWLAWSPFFRLIDRVLSERSAVRHLTAITAQFIEQPIATPVVYARRLARYRRQLEQLHDYCERAGIAAVWYVPAGSESGFEPNRSFVRPGTSHEEQADLRRLFEEGRSLQGSGRWTAAADVFRRGLDRQPEFAEFHFQLAECLFETGRVDEARTHYQRALNLDGHPIRANRDYRQAVRAVAEAKGIPLVDAGELLRPLTPAGILDRTVFHDNVHPTLRAYFQLGIAACERVAEMNLPAERFGKPRALQPAAFSDAVRALEFGTDDLADAYQQVSHDLRWLTRWRFDATRRLRDAGEFESWSRQLRAGTIHPGEAGTEALHE
jgi:tetratricopeptide (TPR) repeat protein